MALTDTQLRNAKSQDKLYILYDEKRLSAEVPTTGSIRWRLKYTFEGKEKRLSLGTYPEVGLKEAREKRDEFRKMVANGIAPADHRKAVKASRVEGSTNTYFLVQEETIGQCPIMRYLLLYVVWEFLKMKLPGMGLGLQPEL